MMQVVVLGVAGVLQPVESLWRAEIQASCAILAVQGHPVGRFREAALARLQAGQPPRPVRTALAVGLGLTFAERRQLQLETRLAIPPAPPHSPIEPLRALYAGHRVALLDAGPASRMEAWIARLGAAELCERRVWTDELGGLARPPRPLAFRWLADRLGVPAGECLYVAGTEPLRDAALSAGWRVWGEVPPDPAQAADLGALAAELETAFGVAERFGRAAAASG